MIRFVIDSLGVDSVSYDSVHGPRYIAYISLVNLNDLHSWKTWFVVSVSNCYLFLVVVGCVCLLGVDSCVWFVRFAFNLADY